MVFPYEVAAIDPGIVSFPKNKEQPMAGQLCLLSSCGVTKDSTVYRWKLSDDKTFWRVTTTDGYLSYFYGDTVLVLAVGQTYTDSIHSPRRFYENGAEVPAGFALYDKQVEKVLFLHYNGVSVLESKYFHPAK